jgi:DNA modification methylase
MLLHGDCRVRLKELADCSVDSVVCDPPYELGFMGKGWDASGVAYDVDLWGEVLRVLKPGGHLLAFGGSRTYHRLACAVEDAGFEIRDQIMWVYGSGFPKSLDVSKAIDKMAGAEGEVVGERRFGTTSTGQGSGWNPNAVAATGRQEVRAPATPEAQRWQGWGTALKPAHEPVVVARKPLVGTVAGNVLEWGVGAINIDGCRVEMGDEYDPTKIRRQQSSAGAIEGAFGAASLIGKEIATYKPGGRWPANFIHDGSDEVLTLFPEDKPQSGSAARFFYCAKAGKKERNAGLDGMPEKRPDQRTTTGMGTFDEKGVAKQSNHHPTVKPINLMRYLCRLVTPPGGTVLDPFLGSGTTGIAATLEGFDFIGIEQDAEYLTIAEARIQYWQNDRR